MSSCSMNGVVYDKKNPIDTKLFLQADERRSNADNFPDESGNGRGNV